MTAFSRYLASQETFCSSGSSPSGKSLGSQEEQVSSTSYSRTSSTWGTPVSTPVLLGIPMRPTSLDLRCHDIGCPVWYGVYGRSEETKKKKIARFSPKGMGRGPLSCGFGLLKSCFGQGIDLSSLQCWNGTGCLSLGLGGASCLPLFHCPLPSCAHNR